MAVVAISDSILTDIADAIRSKNGTEDTYKPSEMPDAIEAISGGGITPTGTIEITQNGVVDVTNYASADVDVPQGTTPSGTKQISITQNGTTTENVTNYASAEITVNVPTSGGGLDPNDIAAKSITSITIDEATDIESYAFYNWNLATVIAPNVTTLKQGCFSYCRSLGSVIFPSVTTFNGTTQFSYAGATSLAATHAILVFPVLGNITTNSAFDRGYFLAIDIGPNCGQLKNDTFYHNTGQQTVGTLILRKADALVTASTQGAITGLRDVYIPKALYDHLGDGTALDYQNATNWKTRYDGGYLTFHQIEGSQYENYYADGTPISS